jgi:hypothetical protein
MPIRRGSCLCGKTGFETSGGANWICFCHCESCRKNTASPFTAFYGINNENFEWTGAPPASFTSSSGVIRYHCADCGTPVAYFNEKWAHETHFYLASLQDADGIEPQFHVHWAEKLPWVKIDDDLPKYPGSADADNAL